MSSDPIYYVANCSTPTQQCLRIQKQTPLRFKMSFLGSNRVYPNNAHAQEYYWCPRKKTKAVEHLWVCKLSLAVLYLAVIRLESIVVCVFSSANISMWYLHYFESQNDVRTEVNSVAWEIFQKLGIPQILKIDHHMDLLKVLLQGHVLYCYCFLGTF